MPETKKSEMINEIESLNLDELDIEELERRVELATAGSPGLQECPDNCPDLNTCNALYPTGCECNGLGWDPCYING